MPRLVPRPHPSPWRAISLGALIIVGACAGSVTPTPPVDRSPGSSSGPGTPTAAASTSEVPTTTPPPSDPDALALERVAGPFASPVGVTNAGDGSGRLFVLEAAGVIRVVEANGTVAPAPFLDIVPRVRSGGERGLLGLAFHPRYAFSGRFFVDYTRQPDGATVIAEYRVSPDPARADPTSERVLMVIPQPAANHNGGGLVFGPDGYLYIAMGDGGGQNDQFHNAQDSGRLLGKILRIDVSAPRPPGAEYKVPVDNPYLDGGGAPEVWAIGLRNPWRISFDRERDDLYIGDVGGGSWEEIDRQPADAVGGLNYGWPIMEGRHCTAGSCTVTGFIPPIAEYSHAEGCSIIGGHVYRGTAQPELRGVYVFGDWCSGRVFTLQVDADRLTPKTVLQSGLSVSSFGEDEAGEIVLVDHGGGGLYRVVVP